MAKMSDSTPPARGGGQLSYTRYVNNALSALCVYRVQRYQHHERELSTKMKPTFIVALTAQHTLPRQ